MTTASEMGLAAGETVLAAEAAARAVDNFVDSTPKVGFFERLGAKMNRNPIPTSVGITATLAAVGYAGYNLYEHGSILGADAEIDGDQAVEVAGAALSAIGSWFNV